MKKPSRFFDERNQGEFSDRETAGTVPFFSPEVLRGQSYSRALDWWSVGITAFNIAYAKLPWKGDKKDKVFREKVATAPVPHDPLIPLSANFVKLIDELLIKDARCELRIISTADLPASNSLPALITELYFILNTYGRLSDTFP